MLAFLWGVFLGAFFVAVAITILSATLTKEGEQSSIPLIGSLTGAWILVDIFLLMSFGVGLRSTGGELQFVPTTLTPILGR